MMMMTTTLLSSPLCSFSFLTNFKLILCWAVATLLLLLLLLLRRRLLLLKVKELPHVGQGLGDLLGESIRILHQSTDNNNNTLQ